MIKVIFEKRVIFIIYKQVSFLINRLTESDNIFLATFKCRNEMGSATV
ncbi:hypothetical protein T481_11890 [Enterococcus faecalis PF3]|nr:hypothetical protein T481_11890 [Enterococcus faecalis PF3]